MPRIIVKALRKRNETGLCPNQLLESAGKSAGLRLFLPINLYKSTRRERQNLYRCVLAPDEWPTRAASDDATAPTLKYCRSAASHCFQAKKTLSDERPTTCGLFAIKWHKRCTWLYSSLGVYGHRDTSEYPPNLDSPLLIHKISESQKS